VDHPVTPGRTTASGRAILSGQIEQIPDILEDPDYAIPMQTLTPEHTPRAMLSVPLLGKDRIEGAMVLSRRQPGLYTQREVDILQTFADQAVIAIENARLLDEVQARTRELSQSLDDLRAAQDRLVQTEKLASLGQLTAGIAHEIKNPLNFVNNFSALSVELTDELKDLLKQGELAETTWREVDELTKMLKSNLEKVVQHGRRADSIVKNMLLHSREGAGERRSVGINSLVEESLNLACHGARAEKAGFSISLKHDLDPEAGAVDLHPQEITRALLNLISNGFYAATRRRAEADDRGFEPVLSATTRNLGTTVEIRIRDNGSGITREVKEKMFNPFFTTKPTGEGSGLWALHDPRHHCEATRRQDRRRNQTRRIHRAHHYPAARQWRCRCREVRMTALVKAFDAGPMMEGAAGCEGRRPKACKGDAMVRRRAYCILVADMNRWSAPCTS
jgi:signal transduction histidine kinase